jgi:hypothetical protein
MKGSLFVQILGGLAIGLALGLLIAWVIAPVQYTDTSPSSMRTEFKDQYRVAIAMAFNATGNLERAQARLSLVGDQDLLQALISQAERMISTGNSPDDAYEISGLVNALSAVSQIPTAATSLIANPTPATEDDALPTSTQTPFGLVVTPKATSTPGSSPTPRPTSTQRSTSTATPTQGAPFVVLSREESCDRGPQEGLIMVEVRNKKRQPIEGQEIIVSWSGGEESFFTGLKPEINNGYADFLMDSNTQYSIRLASGGEAVNGLSAPLCNKEGEEYLGSIKLIFQQP